jgi:cyclic pyranopterin monophosphate synthase
MEIKDGSGMVDITEKLPAYRTATATGLIRLKASTLEAVRLQQVKKGDVMSAAQVAAILAVKDTPRLVPFCHQIPITAVDAIFDITSDAIKVNVTVTSIGQTGVEMEALTGVSAALLNIWDMVKSLEKDETGNYPSTRIAEIKVLEKKKESI